MAQGEHKGRSVAAAVAYATSLWPFLPHLGFGFVAAWLALAHGTAWLSPNEAAGSALTNLVEVIYIAMGVTLGALAVLVRRFHRVRQVVEGRWTALAGGMLASVGSFVLLMMGPSYLQPHIDGWSYPIFQMASVSIGMGFGLLILRIGMDYSALALRTAILYLCYAHLAGAVVYLAVQVSPSWALTDNSPPLAFMVVFVMLPLCAAVKPAATRAPHQTTAEDPAAGIPDRTGGGISRRSMACFTLVLLLFAFAQSALSVGVTNYVQPAVTLASMDVVILFRIPILLCMALLASALEARRLNFGALLVLLICLLEAMILLNLLVRIPGAGWLVPVRVVTFVFELVTWCLILAVANCHVRQNLLVVAVGYGAYALGNGFGTLLGVWLVDAVGESALLVGSAALLIPCFALLNERNLNGLFAQGAAGATTLEEVLGKRLEGRSAQRKGDFRRRLDDYARLNGLTARESEVLRYLVAGRGDSQIAESMGISYNTARTHVRNVYNKIGVHDRQTLIDVIDNMLK